MGIVKKIVKFDKKIHKYNYFLNGCRTLLIKDRLYILGGVDKENQITKMAYTYYIKTERIKRKFNQRKSWKDSSYF